MNASEWIQIMVWWMLLAPTIAVSLSAIPLSIYAFIADVWGGSSKILTALLLPAVISFSFGIAWFFGRLLIRQTRQTIRLSLKRRDACPRCGYSLRGNVSGICPECGFAWRKRTARV